MKLNKYIFATLITSTTLFLGSCSDFLDRSPQGQFTEDDNPNALVNGKIYNVYTMMRNYNVTAGPPAFAIHCFRSEDSEKGSIASDGSDVAEMYDDFVYTPTNGLLGAYWGQNYAIIYQCNEILDAIAEKETAGQTETEDIINKGEASFFRAYCYFNLVRAFGEVPLVTYKINDASEANIPKTSADKIYEQIDKDLKTAEESLPGNMEYRIHRTTDLGSCSFLTRAYLYDAQRLEQYVHSLHRCHQKGALQLKDSV